MRPNLVLGIVAAFVFMVAGCTSTSNDPTTTVAQPTTTPKTETTTTTSTVSTTSTSTPTTTAAEVDPWSIEYPLEADSVDDLPSVLSDKIGAPEPDPILGVEGPDDAERWVNEWLGWFSWVNANPTEGVEALDGAVVPGSTFYEGAIGALENDRDAGTALLGYAFKPVEVSGTFDEFFERGEVLRLVVVAVDDIPSYVIDDTGAVIIVNEPLGGETTIRLLLRYQQEEGEWILENLEVLG